MKSVNLNLHIEELVLRGFSRGDRYRIAKGCRLELTRLFSEEGVPPPLVREGEMARLDGEALEVSSGAKAEAIGAQVAQSVYRGLSR